MPDQGKPASISEMTCSAPALHARPGKLASIFSELELRAKEEFALAKERLRLQAPGHPKLGQEQGNEIEADGDGFKQLVFALEDVKNRLCSEPISLFRKVPEGHTAFNLWKVNRLAGRSVFTHERGETESGDKARILVVHHPDGGESIRWLRTIGNKFVWHPDSEKLIRTVLVIRAWQKWASSCVFGKHDDDIPTEKTRTPFGMPPGGVTFEESPWNKLVGHPREMLAELLKAHDHRCSAENLEQVLCPEGVCQADYPRQVVKDAASALRTTLRSVMREAGVNLRELHQLVPLISTGRGKDLAYHLDHKAKR